jgi:hypothetical protein
MLRLDAGHGVPDSVGHRLARPLRRVVEPARRARSRRWPRPRPRRPPGPAPAPPGRGRGTRGRGRRGAWRPGAAPYGRGGGPPDPRTAPTTRRPPAPSRAPSPEPPRRQPATLPGRRRGRVRPPRPRRARDPGPTRPRTAARRARPAYGPAGPGGGLTREGARASRAAPVLPRRRRTCARRSARVPPRPPAFLYSTRLSWASRRAWARSPLVIAIEPRPIRADPIRTGSSIARATARACSYSNLAVA